MTMKTNDGWGTDSKVTLPKHEDVVNAAVEVVFEVFGQDDEIVADADQQVELQDTVADLKKKGLLDAVMGVSAEELIDHPEMRAFLIGRIGSALSDLEMEVEAFGEEDEDQD